MGSCCSKGPKGNLGEVNLIKKIGLLIKGNEKRVYKTGHAFQTRKKTSDQMGGNEMGQTWKSCSGA